ncbi:MAG TPA: invasin domain 3-containing protein [Longimicrobiales bacterium]
MRIAFPVRFLLIGLLGITGWSCTETVVGVVDVASIDIEPSSASVYVGADLPLQARARDEKGNLLNGRPLNWSSEDPAVATVNGQGVVHGVSTGDADIVATSGGIRATARVTVLSRPAIRVTPDSAAFTLVAGAAPTPATIGITNAGGGALGGLTATITYQGAATGWLDVSLSANTAPATLTITPLPAGVPPGSYDATVRIASSDAGTTPVFVRVRLVVLAAPAAHIAIAGGNNQTAIAGTAVSSPIGVRVTDASDAPLPNVPVTFTVTAGGGSLTGTNPVQTNSNGIAIAPVWTLGSVAGVNRLKATAAGLPGDSVVITATGAPGSASRLAITTQPSASATSGVAFPRQPVIQLQDAGGNVVATAGVAVTAAIAAGGGVLGGTATVLTDNAGVARFTNLSITGTAGERTLVFTSAGFTPATSTPIDITTGAGTRLAVATQPSTSAPSGVPFAQQPALQLQDATGNAVAQAGVVVSAAIASGGGTLGGTLTATTDAAGRATFTNLRISGTIGARTLQFTASGITAATSGTITITVGPASAAHSSAVVPNGIAGSATPITISVRDDGGNPITGAATLLAVAVSGANSATPAVSEIGSGSYAASYTPTATGTDQVAITLSGAPIAGSPFTSAVTNSAVSAGNSTVTAAPTSGLIANGADAATVTVVLRDANGNAITGLAGSFSVAVGSGATAGTVVETSTPGTYTFTVTSTVARTVTVVVTVGSTTLSNQPSIAFVAGPVAPGSSVVASPSSGVPADGSTASTVTVVLADAFGNPIAGLTDASFSIGLTGSAQRTAVAQTATPGTYTFSVTDNVAETVTVTVTAAGVLLSQQPTIQFVGAQVSASSAVTANPTVVIANGVDVSTVTVVLVDTNGQPVTGLAPAAFAVGVTGSAGLGPVTETTAGTYTFTVTDTKAETVTVTVTAKGVQLAAQPSIQFVPGPVSALVSTATANPTSVTAGGGAASTVTVVLADAFGNPIAGLTDADFSVGLTGSAQRTAVAQSGTPGTYTFSVTDNVAETVTVTITAAGVQLSPLAINFTAGVSASSSVSAAPNTGVVADGTTASTVTITLVDPAGAPVAGLAPADFTVGVTGSAVASPVTETGTPGTYTFTVTNTVAEVVTVTVTAVGVQLSSQPTIQFVTVSPSLSTVTASPTTGITANGTAASTVTVSLRDVNNNRMGSVQTTDLTVVLTGSAVAGPIIKTNPAGTFTFTVTNTVAETVTVTVYALGVQLNQQPTITFVP